MRRCVHTCFQYLHRDGTDVLCWNSQPHFLQPECFCVRVSQTQRQEAACIRTTRHSRIQTVCAARLAPPPRSHRSQGTRPSSPPHPPPHPLAPPPGPHRPPTMPTPPSRPLPPSSLPLPTSRLPPMPLLQTTPPNYPHCPCQSRPEFQGYLSLQPPLKSALERIGPTQPLPTAAAL